MSSFLVTPCSGHSSQTIKNAKNLILSSGEMSFYYFTRKTGL